MGNSFNQRVTYGAGNRKAQHLSPQKQAETQMWLSLSPTQQLLMAFRLWGFLGVSFCWLILQPDPTSKGLNSPRVDWKDLVAWLQASLSPSSQDSVRTASLTWNSPKQPEIFCVIQSQLGLIVTYNTRRSKEGTDHLSLILCHLLGLCLQRICKCHSPVTSSCLPAWATENQLSCFP